MKYFLYESGRIDCESDKCGEWHEGGHDVGDLLPEDTLEDGEGKLIMRLSNVYTNVIRYAIVYHTQADSEEVEFVREKFFKSEKAAWKWFERKFRYKDFTQLEIVKVVGFNELGIQKLYTDKE